MVSGERSSRRANAPRGAVKGLEVTAIERVAEALAASG